MLLSDRTKGLLIALLGVVCISPDATVTRYLSAQGIEPWTIVFWKTTLTFPVTAAYALYDIGGYTSLRDNVRKSAGHYLVAVLPQAAVNIGFTFSFVHTTAAHALLLVNLNPLWCTLLGRITLGDKLPIHTIVALVAAMGCMLLTFLPKILMDDDDDDENANSNNDADGQQPSTTKGNVIALFTGITIAVYITVVRKGGIEGHNMVAVTPVACVVGSTLALLLQRGQVGPREEDWEQSLWKFWMAAVSEGAMVGTVYVAMTIAPRLITGTEFALVLLLEVILGPLWVFWAYSETPSSWTLAGGLLLVLVLALHEVFPLFCPPKSEKSEGDDEESAEKDAESKTDGEQQQMENQETADSEPVAA